MTIESREVTLDGLSAYVSTPDRPSGGGVLILPTIFGLNKFQREFADGLAQSGLTALVWNIYPGEQPPTELPEALRRSKEINDARALKQTSAWAGYMRDELKLKKVGALGFCLGGRYGLLLCARDPQIAAFVSLYPTMESPRLPNQEEDAVSLATDIRCPVHLVIAGINRVTSLETSLTLQGNLQRRKVPTSSQLYPDAEHAFMEKPDPVSRATVAATVPHAQAFLHHYLSAT
jgi:carboxymethylenebutenolidase